MVISIATLAYQMLFFRGGSTNDQVQHLHADRLGGELLFRAPLRKYAVAQQFGELLCRNCQREKRTLGHEVVVVSICQRSLEQIWKRCPLSTAGKWKFYERRVRWCNMVQQSPHRKKMSRRDRALVWFYKVASNALHGTAYLTILEE